MNLYGKVKIFNYRTYHTSIQKKIAGLTSTNLQKSFVPLYEPKVNKIDVKQYY